MLAKNKIKVWSNNNLDVDIRQQWVSHIGGHAPCQFPRDLGFPHRHSVSNLKEMLEMIQTRMSNSNSYIQVFSDIQQQANVYDTCYIDIDVEMPFDADEGTKQSRYKQWEIAIEDAHWELKKYVWHMEKTYDANLRVYFSGSRGFSIYVDFEEIQADWGAVVSTIKDTLRDASVNFDLVDESVFEKNRISRLPYTLNWNNMEKRGLDPMFCLPIDPNWNFDTVLSEIKDPTIQKSVERKPETNLVREYIGHRDRTGDYESKKLNTNSEAEVNPEASLERLKVLMELADFIGDGRHRILHFMLVPALIESGWEDFQQIHEVCEKFIEATGASYYPEYYKHVENSIPRTLEGPPGSKGHWKPWTIETFLNKNPELLHHFDASMLE